MKKMLLFLLVPMLIMSGCSKSTETLKNTNSQNSSDKIVMETMLPEETVNENETEIVPCDIEVESENTEDISEDEDFIIESDAILETEMNTEVIEEDDTETFEDPEEFDDSLSETCSHNFEFSDTYVEELQNDELIDLYVCTICGRTYKEPYKFTEEDVFEDETNDEDEFEDESESEDYYEDLIESEFQDFDIKN